VKEISNRPREAHRIPQQRESKLIEHVEVPNTPTTLSRPLALLGSSSEKHHYVELHITPRNQDEGTDLASNPSERETSFHRIQARCMKLSIETMTPEEKVTKIAEIQARPSRKRFFGPDYRLGHVLRQGRQDIHDESDGAWDPKLTSNQEKRLLWEGRSLREKFNLPKNAVPMNDGQELAFRDGTSVSKRKTI